MIDFFEEYKYLKSTKHKNIADIFVDRLQCCDIEYLRELNDSIYFLNFRDSFNVLRKANKLQ